MKIHTALLLCCGLASQGALLIASARVQGPSRAQSQPAEIVARLGAQQLVHGGNVKDVAFLGDGQSVVSLDDREMSVWKLPDGELRFRRAQESAATPFASVRGTADGRVVALAAGAQVGVVNPQRPAEIRWIGRAAANVSALAISADGQWAATGSSGEVTVWDVAQGSVKRRLAVDSNRIVAMALSPDGRRLATSGARGSFTQLWSLEDGKELRRWESFARSVAFSPDGRTLAGSMETVVPRGSRTSLKLYDTATGEERWDFGGYYEQVVYSPDGRLLASGALQHAILLDAATGREIRRMRYGGGLHVNRLAFSPDGTVLATGGDDSRIRLWSTADGKRLDKGQGHDGPAQVVAFSPDGRLIASGGADGAVNLWSWPEGRLAQTFEGIGTNWGVKSLQFSGDSTRLAASANGSSGYTVWDVRTGAQLSQFGSEGPSSAVGVMVFLPDRDHLLTSRTNGSISSGALVVWDVTTGAQTRVIGKVEARVTHMALVADGRQVVWVGEKMSPPSSEIGILDMATGRSVRTLAQVNGYLSGNPLLIAPDGSWLTIGGRAWETETGKVIPGGANQTRDAVVSADGRLIYRVENDGIHIWERLLGRDIHTLQGTALRVEGLAASPDSRVLAAATRDGSIVILDVESGQIDGFPSAPRTVMDFEGLFRIMGGEDHWEANVAAGAFARAGREAVDFLFGKLLPAEPLSAARLEELRGALSSTDVDVRSTAARTMMDHGVELTPSDIEAIRRAETSPPAGFRGGATGFSGIPSAYYGTGQRTDISTPLPDRLSSSRAIAALSHSTAADYARELLQRLAVGHAPDPQTLEAVSALRFIKNR
jgi:WD40 repeat protein